jgi:mono/diheme cytochrome c family protein
MRWSALALCLVASVSRAQSAKNPPTATVDATASAAVVPTTLSGVYTSAQAARGKNVYAGSCRSCHAAQSHTGEVFETFWRGKQLSDLFTFVNTRMPKNDPGSLAIEDVADVVAYLLSMNEMPAGKRELYPDADSLKQYRIEVKGRDSTARRKEP